MVAMNLAGRAGRWSATHWKQASFGWLAFAVLAVVIGGAVGAKQSKPWGYANGDSRRAEQILDRSQERQDAIEAAHNCPRATWSK